MKARLIFISTIFGIITSFLFISYAMAESTVTSQETIKPIYKYAIPNVPGKTVTAIVVDYKPGGKSHPHRHGSAFVVAYVLSGSIRSKVNAGEEKVYKVGESWTENPGDHHTVSENASETEPASLLAIFISKTKEKNLVVFDK
jgi:quercetin dioxygenase-like cupin family protein